MNRAFGKKKQARSGWLAASSRAAELAEALKRIAPPVEAERRE